MLKNVLEVCHKDIAFLAASKKRVFLIGRFWALLPLHPTGIVQKIVRTQKYLMGLLFLSVLPLKAQLDVLLHLEEKILIHLGFIKKNILIEYNKRNLSFKILAFKIELTEGATILKLRFWHLHMSIWAHISRTYSQKRY